MKILVNATTLVVGGGVQVGASFIEYAISKTREEVDFLFAVSPLVLENLSSDLRSDPRIFLVSPSPARIVSGSASRKFLLRLESEFSPNVVYSVGSPSYIRFRSVELARFTDPFGTHPSPMAWRALPFKERLITWLRAKYKIFWLRKVEYFETQTDTAAKGLTARLSLSPARIRVISNAYSFCFGSASDRTRNMASEGGVIKVLTLSAAYRHKNLEIIPPVASLILKQGLGGRYRFVVTLPNEGEVARDFWSLARKYGVEHMISNAGRVKLSDCVALYEDCDIVFMPTLLETFSVTYLEAMAMGRPIVTSDLDFAREVCGEAAAYYSPLSVEAAADGLMKVADNLVYRRTLVERGKRQLARFPPPDEKYRLTMDWLKSIGTNGAMS